MDAQEFLDLADELLAGIREGDWRTSASRAYYAAFHVARALLTRSGFAVPRADQAHAYLWLRLSNAGHPDVRQAGRDLRDLRDTRNRADYDLDYPFPQAIAAGQVMTSLATVRVFRDLATMPTVLAQVIDAIRTYERDVLAAGHLVALIREAIEGPREGAITQSAPPPSPAPPSKPSSTSAPESFCPCQRRPPSFWKPRSSRTGLILL